MRGRQAVLEMTSSERSEYSRPGTVSPWPVLDKWLDGSMNCKWKHDWCHLHLRTAAGVPFSTYISLRCIL